MNAMLLAAGLGTRLRPLTQKTPKPLIPVNGMPLVFYNLALLKKYGISKVVINLHHLGDHIEKMLGSGKRFGFQFQYSYEKKILGTGGGIKKAERLLKNKGPFLVLNADIILDCNLNQLLRFHQKKKAIATLLVQEKPSIKQFGGIYSSNNHEVISILDRPGKKQPYHRGLFTGVSVLEREIFSHLKPRKKLCIVRDGYIPLLAQGEKIGAFPHQGYWNDLGTLRRWKKTEKDLKNKKICLSYEKQLSDFKKILGIL